MASAVGAGEEVLGGEDDPPHEPPEPPSQAASQSGRPVRKKKLNSRLHGFYLGGAGGVGGQCRGQEDSAEVTRPGGRARAEDFFSQPAVESVSQFLAAARVY